VKISRTVLKTSLYWKLYRLSLTSNIAGVAFHLNCNSLRSPLCWPNCLGFQRNVSHGSFITTSPFFGRPGYSEGFFSTASCSFLTGFSRTSILVPSLEICLKFVLGRFLLSKLHAILKLTTSLKIQQRREKKSIRLPMSFFFSQPQDQRSTISQTSRSNNIFVEDVS